MFSAALTGTRSSCTTRRSNSIGNDLLERLARIARRGDRPADDQVISAGFERFGWCHRAPLIVHRRAGRANSWRDDFQFRSVGAPERLQFARTRYDSAQPALRRELSEAQHLFL